MSRPLLSPIVAILSAVGAMAQDPADSGVDLARKRFDVFSLELPATWRRMTVDEMVALQAQLPFELQRVVPRRYDVVGDVDRWLRDGFDGRALGILLQRPEAPIDTARLADIRRFWQEFRDPRAGKKELMEARLVELGADAHPGIECRIVTRPPLPGRPHECLELYVSTSGHQLTLSFRTWQDEFETELPHLRSMVDSLTFARPPKKPEELSDKLMTAAIMGALVGIVFIVIYKKRRAG